MSKQSFEERVKSCVNCFYEVQEYRDGLGYIDICGYTDDALSNNCACENYRQSERLVIEDKQKTIDSQAEKIKELEREFYKCPASRGKEPINESCGGCIGCVEDQMLYSLGNQAEKIEALESQNKILRDTLKKLSQFGEGTSGARRKSTFDCLEELQIEMNERMSFAEEALAQLRK